MTEKQAAKHGKLREIWWLIKETFTQFIDDRGPKLAASLAYYTLFALAPLLVIATAIAAMVFGDEAAQGQIAGQLTSLIGREASEAIQGLIQHANQQGSGTWAAVVGFATLFIGASGAFVEIQDSINFMWAVPDKQVAGIKNFFRHRLLSFAMVVGIGFLLLVSLVVSAVLSAVSTYFSHYLPDSVETVWHWTNVAVSIGVITLLFAMIFKFLPDKKVAWSDTWVGAFFTAVLFTLGKALIGLYLGQSGVTSAYGAAGSAIVVLLWVYYSGIILYLGAEFTYVYATSRGSLRSEPKGSEAKQQLRGGEMLRNKPPIAPVFN